MTVVIYLTLAKSVRVGDLKHVGFPSGFALGLWAAFLQCACILLSKFHWGKTVVTFTDRFMWVVVRLPVEVFSLALGLRDGFPILIIHLGILAMV